MSGGTAGAAGLSMAAGAVIVGSAVAIGATAKVAADITRMGSIAAYEQMQLAAECTKAVKDAKRQREQAILSYQNDSRAALSALNSSMNSDIDRLKSKLERGGHQVNLRELGSEPGDVLFNLILMDRRLEGINSYSNLRIPAEIYRSVTDIIDPLFKFIPAGDPAFRELTELKNRAGVIASNCNLNAAEKSEKLIGLEAELVVKLDEYKQCSNKYEYYLAQFTGLSYANKQLSQACGCSACNLTYEPCKAQTQIEELCAANARLRKTLRSEMRKNEDFIAANRELTRLTIKSVQDAGFGLKGVSEQEYGTSAMFDYRNSLLRVTVSREGMISIDIVGKRENSTEQLKNDEREFCSKDFNTISCMLERNGVSMRTDRICNLTADSMLYEDDFAMQEYQDIRWLEDEPHLMYASPDGRESV